VVREEVEGRRRAELLPHEQQRRLRASDQKKDRRRADQPLGSGLVREPEKALRKPEVSDLVVVLKVEDESCKVDPRQLRCGSASRLKQPARRGESLQIGKRMQSLHGACIPDAVGAAAAAGGGRPTRGILGCR
jgi:hypothetical protein